jgi:ABC-type glycerol-3-phosphate transport system substrate-binding protein
MNISKEGCGMKTRYGFYFLVLLVFIYSSGALGKNYMNKLGHAVHDYANKEQFKGVKLNVACRHLPAMDFLEDHKKLFEQYTGAKIHVSNYPENDLRSKIVSDASNKAGGFEVYCLDNNYIPQFADNGWVHALNGQIKSNYDLDDIFKKLRGTYSWQSKLYGLPIYSEVTLLYYRKDLFKKNGLKPPKTLSDLTADAKKLNNPPQTFGIALRGLRGEGMNVYPWTEWLRSYGGDFLNKKMEPVFNDAAGIKATKHYKKLIQDYGPPGSGAWGWPKVESAFSSGRVAMTVESSAFYPIFADKKQSSVAGKVGYAVVPKGPKGRYPANYSIGLAVASSVSSDSKRYKAAMSFIQWATSKQMEMARTDDGIGNADRKSVQGSDLLSKKVNPAYTDVVRKSQKITKTNYRPRIPRWREMGDILGRYLEKTFTKQASVKDALDGAAKDIKHSFKNAGVLGKKRTYQELFESSK